MPIITPLLSADLYQGPPIADMTLDGVALPSVPVTVPHGQPSQRIEIEAAPGLHALTIGFANDAWGGTADTDRNLYLDGMDGVVEVVQPHAFMSSGTITLTVTVPDDEASLLARLAAAVTSAGAALADAATTMQAFRAMHAQHAAAALAPPALPDPAPAQAVAAPTPAAPVLAVALPAPNVPAAPIDHSPRILLVGSDKPYISLTDAMVDINGKVWNNGYDGGDFDTPCHIIVSPEATGYYTDDAGSHSRRWGELRGWPPWDGNLRGPVIIEGEPGKPAPHLDCKGGFADGVLYYQQGLFITSEKDATFRNLRFSGFSRQDKQGNYAGVRLGPSSKDGLLGGTILFEDCEFDGNDNGIMGEGNRGLAVILRRCESWNNGTGAGLEHNFYFGHILSVLAEDCYSHDCNVGHLIKSRAMLTELVRCRLLSGVAGRESACLDVPNGGTLRITDTIMEKGALSDAGWMIHFGGENQPDSNSPALNGASSITIRGLTLVAPPSLTQHPIWGPPTGLTIQSSGVTVDAQGVQAFGLLPDHVGMPCTMLDTAPTLDRSPLRA